jgi:hypothetical protein
MPSVSLVPSIVVCSDACSSATVPSNSPKRAQAALDEVLDDRACMPACVDVNAVCRRFAIAGAPCLTSALSANPDPGAMRLLSVSVALSAV